jgi:hypothetical protein
MRDETGRETSSSWEGVKEGAGALVGGRPGCEMGFGPAERRRGRPGVFAMPERISFPVTFGNFCSSMCLCGPGAISQTAIPQYVADVSKTPLGTGAVPLEACFCDELGILCWPERPMFGPL